MRVQLNRKFNYGFTYIGLLLFIAITGVGLSVAGMSWQSQVRAEKEKQLLFVGAEFRNAINSYYASTPDAAKVYPHSLNDLLLDKRTPYIKRHLRKIYLDPMTGKADWELVTLRGRIIGVNSRSNLTPYKHRRFNAANAQLADAKSYKDWVFISNIADQLKEENPIIQQPSEVLVNESLSETSYIAGQKLVKVDRKGSPQRSGTVCNPGDCLNYDQNPSP